MSLFTDIRQIEQDQQRVLGTLTHLHDEVAAGFKTLEDGQDRQDQANVQVLLQLENVANSLASTAAGIQTLIEKMQELIDLVRGPPVVGIAIEPGEPTSRP